jgi:hypothetical protein
LKKDKYNEVRNYQILTSFYRERKQFTRSELSLKKANTSLLAFEQVQDIDYYHWKKLLVEESLSIDDIKGKALDKENISTVFYSINEESILNILGFLSSIVLRRKYFESDELAIFLKIDHLINEHPILKNNVLLRLYQLALRMFESIDNEDFVLYYEEYSILFAAIKNKMDKDVIYSLSTRERTCLVYRYSAQPNLQNLGYLFDTYKRHLSAGTLLLNGRIHSIAATNLIGYAIRLDEIAWIKQFLNQWQDKIGAHDDNNEEVVHICWAMYYFANKEFDQAEKNILGNFENFFHLLSAKRFRIKIHFERNEFDKMYLELDAFKTFIFRNVKSNKDVPKAYYGWNNNFITSLKQIYALKFNPNTTRKKQLIEKINKQVCSDKEWLLEKAKAV